MNKSDYGWDEFFQKQWDAVERIGLVPVRVVADFGSSLHVVMPEPMKAILSGKLAHYADDTHKPKVGDWAAARIQGNDTVVIEYVLERKNEIARKVAGKRTQKQIIAANVDVAFIVQSLDEDFSLERLKRFLFQLHVGDIRPVIILNKADKTNDPSIYIEALKTIQVPVFVCSALHEDITQSIYTYIPRSATALLIGSSGVGKSTITNQLLGTNIQTTNEVRKTDGTGVHTTVHRELFVLPNGGLLIDTPGIRELQLWGITDELDNTYADIKQLATTCTFKNCTHSSEKGCAVVHALQSGKLQQRHFANYQKMQTELIQLDVLLSEKAKLNNQKSHKKLNNASNTEFKEMLAELDE